jgi:hypothetical protein
MGKNFVPPLTPLGWFEDGYRPGVHLWTPLQGAALIALKELARSWHKRPLEVTHVVMIPRLLWDEEWRSCFEKEMDFWFILHNVLCGLTLLSNHFWLEFLSQFSLPLALFPGRSNRNGQEWWTWDAPCHVCQRRVTYESGIICANFGLRRGHFPVCRSVWYASCFTIHPLD